MRDRLMSSAS